MGDSSYAQNSFLGGEWAQSIQGRFDEPGYKTALNVCFNAFPTEEGNWTRRPGTQFAGFSRRGALGRLIAFDLISSAPYDFELTPGFLRVWKGQQLALAEATETVTSISSANPAVLVPGSARTWNTGDTVQIFITTDTNYKAAAYLANRQFVVTKINTTHFSLADQLGNTLDGSLFALGATVATVAKILEIPTPWANQTNISNVRIAQSEGQVLMFCYQVQTQLFTINTANTPAFTMAAALFVDGPYLDPPTDASSVQSSATSGAGVTLTFSSSRGFTAGDVGRNIRLLSEPKDWVSGHAYNPGDKSKYNGAYYNCIVATGTTNPPDTTPASQALCPSAVQWCYAVITGFTDNKTVTVTLANIPKPPGPVPVITPVQNPLLYTHDGTNPITTYQLGLYTNNGTVWPTVGTSYKGRFWLAGGVQNRVDSTVALNGLVCSPTYYDGTVADDNGISAPFNFPEIMSILWLHPVQTGLLCGTQTGEVLIRASQLGDPITPTSIDAEIVTRYGGTSVEPLRVGYSSLFVQRYAKKVLDFTADVFSGRHNAMNVSLPWKHLAAGGILEIRFQRELAPIMWATTPNGKGNWIGMSYKRESSYSAQGPTFNGGHQHTHGSGNRYPVSISTGTVPGGATDTLGMMTTGTNPALFDYNTGHIEFLTQVFQEGQSLSCAWELDDAIIPISANVTASGGVSTGIQFYGLWHLIGRTVTAYLGGLDCGDYVVAADSSVTVLFGACGGLFTLAYYQSFSFSACNLATVTYTVPQPPVLANPTILSMGTVTPQSINTIADWSNRIFYAPVAGYGGMTAYSLDTGNVLATNSVALSGAYPTVSGPDSNGNIYTNAGSGGIWKLAKSTLATLGSFGVGIGFGNPVTSFMNGQDGLTSITADANYIVSSNGDNVYVFNGDTMQFAGCYQVIPGAAVHYTVAAGAQGSGNATAWLVSFSDTTALDVATVVISKGAAGYDPATWPTVNSNIVVAAKGTVAPSAIDATWTHISAVPAVLYDKTDGNLIVVVSTGDAVAHQHRIAKINTTTLAVMWSVFVGASGRSENGSGGFSPASNTRIQYGAFAYYDSNGSVYCIDTVGGTILSTVAVSGLTAGGDIASDDTTGDIMVYGSYTQGGGTPVPIGHTPSSYSNLWGRLDLAASAGIGIQNRTANFTAPAVIGFTYNSDGQLLRPQDAERSGARNGPALGKKRKHHQVALQLLNAANGSVQFGTKFPPQYIADFKLPGDKSYPVTTPFTATYWNTVVDDYSFDGMLCWRIGRPYPLTVTAIEGYLHTQDK